MVVVGGGYTGLWTAWQLKQLRAGGERRRARGGGLRRRARAAATAASSTGSGSACRRCASASATRGDRRRARRPATRSTEIGDFCREQRVDAWYRQAGYLQVSTAPAWDGAWEPAMRGLPRARRARRLRGRSTPSEVAARCDSPIFRGGGFYPGAATVQPARLARGLARRGARARGRGLRAQRGDLGRAPRRRRGRRDEARAACGPRPRCSPPAARSRGCPRMRHRLTLTSSHIVITEPVPDLLEEIGWTGGECITDSRAMVHYFRTTPDGRIAFGWGGGRVAFGARTDGRAERDPAVIDEVRAPPAPLLPRARGQADRARLGRADRRLAQPPAGDRRARAGHPLRLRLHRPRRRALAHGRPLARLAGARAPRRGEPARVRRPAGRCGCRPSRFATSADR